MANGTAQMTGAFLASSTTNTITAGDNNNTNILQGTSSIIMINEAWGSGGMRLKKLNVVAGVDSMVGARFFLTQDIMVNDNGR